MIELNNVTLSYQVFHDKSSSLKEAIINLLHQRKYSNKGTSEFNALDHVNLTIKDGERLGIIGRNGAGKSTILKVLSGILQPSAGKCYVDGKVQPLIEIAAGFNPEFSGRENIYLNGYMLGFNTEQIKEKEKEIISFSELEDFIDVPVKYYSSGMSVRLAFTIATSIDPEILLFDEMLSAGDAAFIEKAKHRMTDLINRARQVVVVSHDLNFIKSFTTRAIVLEHGKIVFDGPPEKAVKFYLNTIDLKQNHQTLEANLDKVELDIVDNNSTILRFSGTISTEKEILLSECLLKGKVNNTEDFQYSLHRDAIKLDGNRFYFQGNLKFDHYLIASVSIAIEVKARIKETDIEISHSSPSILTSVISSKFNMKPEVTFNIKKVNDHVI